MSSVWWSPWSSLAKRKYAVCVQTCLAARDNSADRRKYVGAESRKQWTLGAFLTTILSAPSLLLLRMHVGCLATASGISVMAVDRDVCLERYTVLPVRCHAYTNNMLLRRKQNVRIIENMTLYAAPCATAACFCMRTVWPVATRNQRRRKVEKCEEIRGTEERRRKRSPRNSISYSTVPRSWIQNGDALLLLL